MKDDNRNIILAVVLSAIVLIGWMLVDARFVSTTYGEDFLLSSREGDE